MIGKMAEKFAFERTQDLNAEIEAWASRLEAATRASAPSRTGGLRESIKKKLYKNQGEIYRIAVSFDKEGAYVQVGAGRGHAGIEPSKATTSIGNLGRRQTVYGRNRYSTSKYFWSKGYHRFRKDASLNRGAGYWPVYQDSIGQMGKGGRRAADWLNANVEKMLPELAGILAHYTSDAWIKAHTLTANIVI